MTNDTRMSYGDEHDLRSWLGSLLAVIHRDAGYYAGEHGLSKSVKDARTLSLERICEIEELTRQNAELREKIDQWKEVKKRYQFKAGEYAGQVMQLEKENAALRRELEALRRTYNGKVTGHADP